MEDSPKVQGKFAAYGDVEMGLSTALHVEIDGILDRAGAIPGDDLGEEAAFPVGQRDPGQVYPDRLSIGERHLFRQLVSIQKIRVLHLDCDLLAS